MGNLGLVPATGSARGKVLFDKKDPSKFTEGTGSTRGHDRWKKKEEVDLPERGHGESLNGAQESGNGARGRAGVGRFHVQSG